MDVAQLWRDAERTHKAKVARLTQLWREEKAAKVAYLERAGLTNSYFSFSMRDESTKKRIPILRSRSAPNAAHRFKEIDVTVHESTIRKAAGQIVAGTIYTPLIY